MQKLGKEIKIGLAVIGLLVAAFGYILFRKLTRPDDLAAATPAAAALSTRAAPTADKPTVVSATVVGQPASPSTDNATAAGSLFSSARRPRATEATNPGAEPRGSFMPAANSDVAAGNSAAAGNVSPAAPENRFSQFGNHDSAPSTVNSSATAAPATSDAANDAPARHHHAVAADGNHSLFTAGNNTPAAETTVAPAAIVAGGASADPFQRNSAALGSPPERTSTASLAATQSPATMPAEPSPPQQAVTPAAAESNPLRQPADAAARPASAASPDVVASEFPRNTPPAAEPTNVAAPASSTIAAPQSAFSSAQTIPPPITPVAISVPTSQAAPTEPAVTASPVSATSPAVPEAAPHKAGQYIVQPNDNYWTVSEKVYGTGGYFKAIYEHNRRQHSQSERLQVGDALDVPEVAALEQMYPELCPKSASASTAVQASATVAAARPQAPGTRRYVVADGDTLFEIARRELGQSSRWGEIYQLNHDQLGNTFDYLRAGTQLLLPADGSPTAVARESTGTLQR